MLNNLRGMFFLDVGIEGVELAQIGEDESGCGWVGRVDGGEALLLSVVEVGVGWADVAEAGGWVVEGPNGGTAVGDNNGGLNFGIGC